MNIAILVPSLAGGGAERTAADLAARFHERDHGVHVVTWADPSTDVHRVAVRRTALGLASPSRGPWTALRANFRRVRALRRTLASTRPDVVLAFMGRMGVLAVIAARPLRVPVVITERCDPRKEPLGLPWRMLRSHAYRRAAAVVPNSTNVARWFAGWLGDRRVGCIPNLVDPPARPAAPTVTVRGPFVLALGRLVSGKGHADLIRAFARCPADWRLVIVGEGPERAQLEAVVASCGVRDRVSLPGYSDDPWPWLHACDVFAFPSYHEGFPNALLEAMAAGKPCVSYDCGTGPREIITNGVNGCLVPVGNERGLASRLTSLMEDAVLRRRLGDAARLARSEYAPEPILRQWERVLLSSTWGVA